MEISINKKINFIGIFGVASVLFSSHAGGGFATGNQANQYFVNNGILGIFSAMLAMLVLTMTIKECIVMANLRGINNYKELFETLYHPFNKLELLFEFYFHIMVICAVGAVIAGAASLISSITLLSYFSSILIVGVTLLFLTMFGANMVSKFSTIMSIAILISVFVIFYIGIKAKSDDIIKIVTNYNVINNYSISDAIKKAFIYAGFQSVVIPTMIACGKPLGIDKNVTKSMTISFFMNSIALTMSVIMLIGWNYDYTSAGSTTLPTLYICKSLNITSLYFFYNIALLLCFISTGVTIIYGFTSKFASMKFLNKIENIFVRRIISSSICMIVSMSISSIGLTKIIKYGYGYCGYVGIFIIIIPFLTIGKYKNLKYIQTNKNKNKISKTIKSIVFETK